MSHTLRAGLGDRRRAKMTAAALNSPKDYALYYRNELGFSVFPILSDPPKERKSPILGWKAYQKRHPTPEEIVNWYRINPNYNLAAATGDISKILAVDIDGPTAAAWLEQKIPEMSINLQVALKNTMVNRTGSGGQHIVLRLEEHMDVGGQKLLWKDDNKHSEIKLKGNGGLIVLPPSIHESGNRYQWNGKKPDLITPQELRELIRVLSLPELQRDETEGGRARQNTNLSQEGGRALTPDKMQELLYWTGQFYKDGDRNDIIYYISGFMRLSGFTHETARAFVKSLCKNSRYTDEDLPKSLGVVYNTYEQPIDQIKGVSGLRGTLVINYENTVSIEEYLARCEAFSRICQIINGEPHTTAQQEGPSASSSATNSSNNDKDNGEDDASRAVKALKLVMKYSEEVFLNEFNRAFAAMKMPDGHVEVHPMDESKFKNWISAIYYNEYEKLLSEDDIKKIVRILV